jgi:hypothetical protein
MKDARANMDAMLRHLGCGQDLRDFPGTASEKVALMRTASKRRLIAWRKPRGRYELTSIGWSELTPRRRFSLASLTFSTAMGAVIGAAALAILWLPADASRHSIHLRSTASLPRLEKPVASSIAHPVDLGVREAAPAQAAVALVTPPAGGHEPVPNTAPGEPIEPPMVADSPRLEQPSADPAPTIGKQASVKKSHHKTAYRRRNHRTGPAWASGDPWRAQQFRYSGYSNQGSWLAYR